MGRSVAISGNLPGKPNSAEQARILAVRARRMRQRRQVLDLIAASYLIDAAILLLYAFAGTIPLMVAPAYAFVGLTFVVLQILLSEAGFNDRFKDHYLILPISGANLVMMIGFSFWVPQVAFLFLCVLFIVFAFASLRATRIQAVIVWIAVTAALAVLFLITGAPLDMPHGSLLERLATMLALALTIGRCMFIGMYSNEMRDALYKRGLQLKEAYQRIEELAELDELTGAYNRRCIMRMLDEEIERARRCGEPLSLALIDLDWFKRINDTFGHLTGDEVLRTFAISIFANIRVLDRFGRYGGEEFLMLLPNTSRQEACGLLDRLRIIVADLDWSAFSPGMRVTLSAGVTTLSFGEQAETILARADTALYTAKAEGRDRIAIA